MEGWKNGRAKPARVLEFAVEAAQLAGAVTLGYFNANHAVRTQGRRSPVTAADAAPRQLLRARIQAALSRDGILGEEFGEQPGGAAGDGYWTR